MGKEKPIRPPRWKPTTENILDYLGDLKDTIVVCRRDGGPGFLL